MKDESIDESTWHSDNDSGKSRNKTFTIIKQKKKEKNAHYIERFILQKANKK